MIKKAKKIFFFDQVPHKKKAEEFRNSFIPQLQSNRGFEMDGIMDFKNELLRKMSLMFVIIIVGNLLLFLLAQEYIFQHLKVVPLQLIKPSKKLFLEI